MTAAVSAQMSRSQRIGTRQQGDGHEEAKKTKEQKMNIVLKGTGAIIEKAWGYLLNHTLLCVRMTERVPNPPQWSVHSCLNTAMPTKGQ